MSGPSEMRSPREVSLLAVTVEDLFRLALPTGTDVVGGARGLSRDVTWAASFRTFPAAFPSLKGGEIALLSLEALRQLEPPLSLEQIVPRLAARGVSAVAFVGEASPAAAAAADRAAIPLLRLPTDVSLHDLETSIIRALSERRAELYRQDMELQERLTELALRGRGLSAIVQTLADISGKAAILQDDVGQLRLLCQPTGHRWSLSEESVSAALAAQPPPGCQPRYGETEPGLNATSLFVEGRTFSQLSFSLVIGTETVGFLSLLSELEVWDRLDYLLLARTASSCALELSKERAVVEAESRLRGDFLTELLESPALNEEAMMERARRLGHDLSRPHTVVLWRLDIDSDEAGKPWTQRLLESTVRNALARSYGLSARHSPLVHAKGSAVAAVCPSGPDTNGRPVESVAEEVRRALGQEVPGVTISAGVGRAATGARTLRTAYQEAQQALAVAQKLFGGDRSASFAELGFYRLLLPLHGSNDLHAFYREVLGSLEAYDRQNHSELVRTLETFFHCNANQQLAAQALRLHRNTLAYRLRRIQELTGLDLDSLEDRFQLQLALKIRRVL